jgi:hypothetical protein
MSAAEPTSGREPSACGARSDEAPGAEAAAVGRVRETGGAVRGAAAGEGLRA